MIVQILTILLGFLLSFSNFIVSPVSIYYRLANNETNGFRQLKMLSALVLNQHSDEVNRVIPQTISSDRSKAPVLAVKSGGLVVTASSSVALDGQTGAVLYEQFADSSQPIASITKLMTALVFLDHNPGWDKLYAVREGDKRDGGKINFFSGDEVLVRDLFFTGLVASDNSAIVGLANASGLSMKEFVAEMNVKAKELGLTNTSFADPTGLDNNNLSTARDVAVMAQAALAKPEIQEAVLADDYSFVTAQGKARHVYSTDKLLAGRGQDIRILGGKTGYLEKAGYCFVGQFAKNSHPIIVAVLGTDNKQARFNETRKIVEWVYDNYQWRD